LAKTAKIACFLNGDGTANIIHGDGLYDHEKLIGIKFDIILSNPPYSIDGFKKYLDVKVEYELLKYLTENSNEIEVLFIERAKQVLEEKGRVAIILPSSILTNSGIYKKAREMILKYFEIKGIAKFGDKTFIATGTNTVILFLQRRRDGLATDRERIARELFDEREIKENDYVDIEKLLKMFAEFRGLPYEDYKKFVLEDEITENLKNTEIFKLYESKIDEFEEVKQEQGKREFSRLSEEEQNQRLIQSFKNAIRRIEKEKFFYFTLTLREGEFYNDENWYKFQKVAVARAPQGTEERKKYLGYESSERRGYEGIKIYRDENGKPTTKLYDDEDYENPKKVAYYTRKSFKNELEGVSVEEEIKEYVSIYNLPELFDFDREDFDLVISLSPKRKEVISSKWEMRMLGNLLLEIKGEKTKVSKKLWKKEGTIPVVSQESEELISGYVDGEEYKPITDLPLIVFGDHTCVFKYIDFPFVRGADGVVLFKFNQDFINSKFAYYLLKYRMSKEIPNKDKYERHFKYLQNLKIPFPPLEIQREIVEKIENLEKKEEENQKKIEEFKGRIENKINQINEEMKRLEDEYNLYTGSRPKGGAVSYGVISIGGEHIQNGEIDLSNPKYVPQEYVEEKRLEKVKQYDVLMCKDGALSGKVALLRDNIDAVVNEHVFIIRSKDNNTTKNKYLFYLLNSPQWQSKVRDLKTGSAQGGINSTNLKNFKIPFPPLEIQEKMVKEIEELENEIKQLQEENQKLQEEKQKILNEYPS
jgi:type I restriction enzyme M protein